ncbi:MAG: hypothetical protein JWP75_4140 [Frondihabitans sp.]|nr:hypothetical protein [Frondihabitans sp.]
MPVSAIDHFESNLDWVRNLLALARALDASTTDAVDVGDIQRAAIVMAVSALDHYVHEHTRQGMFEVLNGARPRTQAFGKFTVSMTALIEARSDPTTDDWLDDAVKAQHGHKPFMKADDIADALRLISGAPLWPAVGAALGNDAATAKATLKIIVDRRNKIAHEADLDPTQPGVRWPISDGIATDAVDKVEAIVRAIEASV